LNTTRLESKYGASAASQYIEELDDATEDLAENELTQYLSTKKTYITMPTFLLEWKKLGAKFPKLHALVNRYACVQVSAASIERVWSQAGRVATFDRSMLSDATFNKLLALKINNPVIGDARNLKRTRVQAGLD